MISINIWGKLCRQGFDSKQTNTSLYHQNQKGNIVSNERMKAVVDDLQKKRAIVYFLAQKRMMNISFTDVCPTM